MAELNVETILEMFEKGSSDAESFYGFEDHEINRGAVADDISVDYFSSSDDEAGEDLETENQREGPMRWTENLTRVFIRPFTELSGPVNILGEDKKEADFFHQMFPEELYELLAEQTNLYAEQSQAQRREDELWRPTTADEMKTFIGMRIFMSVVDLPEIKMYWSEDKFFGNFGIADVMPRTRFEKLSQYLHANNREGYDKQDPNRDKLHLIQPILDIVLERCQENCNPHRDVSVDEAMIKFRGRLGFRKSLGDGR